MKQIAERCFTEKALRPARGQGTTRHRGSPNGATHRR